MKKAECVCVCTYWWCAMISVTEWWGSLLFECHRAIHLILIALTPVVWRWDRGGSTRTQMLAGHRTKKCDVVSFLAKRIRFTFIGAWHLVIWCVANSRESQPVHPPIGNKKRKKEGERWEVLRKEGIKGWWEKEQSGKDGLYWVNGRWWIKKLFTLNNWNVIS